MEKLAKTVRVITVPPISALIFLTVLIICRPPVISFGSYAAFSAFYTLLPLISYPVSHFCPSLKKGGRKTERKVAVIFSVIGYFAAVLFAAITHASHAEWIICLTYLFSGLVIAVCSLLKFKASGHTCGFSGPVTCLCFAVSPLFAAAYILLVPIIWSSLKTKRHTLQELISGAVISAAINCILWLLIK